MNGIVVSIAILLRPNLSISEPTISAPRGKESVTRLAKI